MNAPERNMMFECITEWLRSHSVSVARVGNELQFKHSESHSSLLILKDDRLDNLIPVESDLLRGLFAGCMAASIGNGHLIIGSTAKGGIMTSHGYRIPDLNEMRLQAADIGMKNPYISETFMIEASWMFLYGVVPGGDRLLRFDRDFGTYESLSSIESVLCDWWQVAINT